MSRRVRWDESHPWKHGTLDPSGVAEFAVTTLEDIGLGVHGEIDPETLVVHLDTNPLEDL